MAQPFDEKRGQLTGEAVPIAESVQRDRLGRAAFSLSANGALVYRPAAVVEASMLTWFDSSGQVAGVVGGVERNNDAGRVSPDRTKVVVPRNDGRSSDVWVIDVARGVPSRLTFSPGPDSAPAWFPDSNQVVWRSDRNGKTGIYRRAISGAGDDQLVYESALNLFPQQVSADGKTLLFNQSAPGGWDIWAMPMTGDGTPVPVVTSPFNEFFAALSPDGRWLAYGSNKAGGSQQVYVQSYPVANQEVRISSTSGRYAEWSADGRRLYYLTQDNAIMSADLTFSGGTLAASAPVQLFRRTDIRCCHFGFDPVGPRFLLAVPSEDAGQQGQLSVVLNWASGLRK